jgi:FKBP-type peptidyl-prolyl cis-trans isomerase
MSPQEECVILRRIVPALLVTLVAAMTFAQTNGGPPKITGEPTKTPSGLKYWDIKKGTGAVAVSGMRVKVHYTGWLASNGKKFDSSVDRNEPFPFQLGGGQVIKGWDEGVKGMKVGGKRRLEIPAELGYGSRAMGSDIPANSTLIFDVDLLDVQ